MYSVFSVVYRILTLFLLGYNCFSGLSENDDWKDLMNRPTADEINAKLADGGVVQVSTYTRSTIYTQKHAGMFLETADGSLAVRRGKSVDRLSIRDHLLVAIRFGKIQCGRLSSSRAGKKC